MTTQKPTKPASTRSDKEIWAYRIDRLRVRHLRLLTLVDRSGSLGSAARELGISQPAVTLLLRELETVFNAKLVQRDAHGSRLTASGRQALDRLTIAQSAVERAIQVAQTPKMEPPLRLGCIQVAGVGGLPAALNRLDKAGALNGLQIREGRTRDLLAALWAGELDCVIGWIDELHCDQLPVGDLRIEPLWYGRMQVVAAVSHPLAKLPSVTVGDLADCRWIVPPPGSRTHEAYRRLFVREGIVPPTVAVECSAVHTALHFVSATRLITLAPDTAVRRYTQLGMVKPLRGASLHLDPSPVSVVTRRDSDDLSAVQDLRRALLAQGNNRGKSGSR